MRFVHPRRIDGRSGGHGDLDGCAKPKSLGVIVNRLFADELADFEELERSARDNPPEGYTFGHWAIDTDTADEFARCEATGLHGACYQFEAVYFHKGA